MKYNVVSLAFDENTVIKPPSEPPKFIGSKYGIAIDSSVIPRSLATHSDP